ncbi:hypothetical protein [Algoriphagus aquimarinus]|uniref:Uncharacterized protein n=1 Tax=Algoriphagus aquimarinus TaxID=237018 RepID=A0A1I1ARY0_9BACT|nr:hypothetical protein [Algoriphagus aquimarinus]SFB40262.1 hypothetical protein SAMN04489723_10942 [Algoriphagus aquimarinus]
MKAIEENPIMLKRGHLVKFHTPYPEEDPSQLYLLLEVKDHDHFDTPWADILALGTGFSFPSINMVKLEDLEVVEWDSFELIGHYATVVTEEGLNVSGKIVHILENENNTKPLQTLKIHVMLKDERGEMTAGELLLNAFRQQTGKTYF